MPLRISVLLSTACLSSFMPADTLAGPFIQTGQAELAPIPFVIFCRYRYPQDCVGTVGRIDALDGAAPLSQLNVVNRRVNASIQPRAKEGADISFWNVHPRYGDCNDYAVTKRHELLALGWPSHALLLAVVKTSWGEGHLILVVRTDTGDLVLDNLQAEVLPWQRAPYTWYRIMAAEGSSTWQDWKAVLSPSTAR